MKYARKTFVLFRHLSSQEGYAGNRVGLAISQRIVHLHGGQIWVKAGPDKGSSFLISGVIWGKQDNKNFQPKGGTPSCGSSESG